MVLLPISSPVMVLISPPDMDIFSPFMEFSMSLKLIFKASILNKSTCTFTSLSNKPLIGASEISLSASTSSCKNSACSLSSLYGKLPYKFTFITGNSEKSSSNTLGSWSKSFGRSFLALSTASFTSCKASAAGTSKLNSAIMMEKSCTDVDLSLLIPVSPFSSFSSGLVTRFSISEGEFPKYAVLI